MKKLLSFSTLCIFACVILSSCSSNLTIAKRHYRGGYYVDYTKKAHSVNYASTKPERKATPASLSSPELPGIPEQYVATNNQINTTLIDIPANKKAPFKSRHSVANTKQTLNQPFAVAKSATSAVQSTPVFAYEGNAGYDDGGRAALSLLWIVIIVILILWILGLAAGVGGFINVLLVIALVLLILWLLRII